MPVPVVLQIVVLQAFGDYAKLMPFELILIMFMHYKHHINEFSKCINLFLWASVVIDINLTAFCKALYLF